MVSASDRTVFRSLSAASSILKLILPSTTVLRMLNVPDEYHQSSHRRPDFCFVRSEPIADSGVLSCAKIVIDYRIQTLLAAASESMITSKPRQSPVGLMRLLPNARHKFVHFRPGWVNVNRAHDLF